MGFIYKVTNKVNGKVYIGKTLDSSIAERFKEHIKEAKVKQYNRPFHLALNKYGAENFIIEEIEQAPANELSKREIYWISFYHSYIHDPVSNGYNATKGGEGSLEYDYGKVIAEYHKTQSITQTANNLKCSISTVQRAIREYNVPVYKQRARGVKIIGYNDMEELTFDSIRQAAEFLSKRLNKDMQTIRKRITSIINHKPNQKGYGYYWKEQE